MKRTMQQTSKFVLDKAHQVNLKMNKSKCKIGADSGPCIGHVLIPEGLKIDPKKTHDIHEMPAPTDKAGVQRFLGMVNYVSKFISNVSGKAQPLRELIHKEVDFVWEERHVQAFNQLKKDITSPPVLRFYDCSKPVKLTCDASKSGLGTVCIQEDMPVAYASKSLMPT